MQIDTLPLSTALPLYTLCIAEMIFFFLSMSGWLHVLLRIKMNLFAEVGWVVEFTERHCGSIWMWMVTSDVGWFQISDPTERPGQPILCFPFGTDKTTTFLTYCYPYDHSLMCSICLSLCLSAWITNSHSVEKQLSELTFSKQWGEHSEISIRLPSSVPTVFVGPLHGISPLSHSKLEPFGVPYKMNPVY